MTLIKGYMMQNDQKIQKLNRAGPEYICMDQTLVYAVVQLLAHLKPIYFYRGCKHLRLNCYHS